MNKEEIIEAIEEMSVLELSELVEELEEKFGVSAAAPVAVGAAAGQPGDGGEEEKTEFDVFLAEIGDSKINVIKAVKDITGKGLKDAKAVVDEAPQNIAEGLAKEEAEEMKEQLEEAGATIELK
ncbi:MAG: 50S ribosomal protein L7/L12 [Halanaerobiales bacterium]